MRLSGDNGATLCKVREEKDAIVPSAAILPINSHYHR
jgi:hypothetical protein